MGLWVAYLVEGSLVSDIIAEARQADSRDAWHGSKQILRNYERAAQREW
jgi:hypothetical protein